MMLNRNSLIKRYIKLVLEDGADATGTYAMGGYTVYTDAKGLENIFFGPMKNIFKVAEGESKKLLSTAKLATKVTKGILRNFIPGIRARFDTIFRAHHDEMKQIESSYKKFYDAAFAPFDDADFKVAAFLWNPTLFMAGKILIGNDSTPRTVSSMLKGAGGFIKSDRNEYELEKDDEKDDIDAKVQREYEKELQKKRQARAAAANSASVATKKDVPGDATAQRAEALQIVDDFISKVISEANGKNRLSSISSSYREKFKSGINSVVNELKSLHNMSDSSFIQKYAKSLGDTEKLYKQVEDQLKNAKDSSTEGARDAIDLIESKKKEIISGAKESLKNAYLEVMRGQKKEIEKSVSELSNAWGLSVDPASHGQIVALDKAIAIIDKIEV